MSVVDLVQIGPQEFRSKEIDLRKPADSVTDFGQKFQRMIDDLIETFWSHNIAVGLAAPQIGIPLKFAVINHTRDRNHENLLLVNPIIISLAGKRDTKKEACMSVPGYSGDVERRKKVSIDYQDRHGTKRSLEAEGFLARVIQHEIDHLEGFLYLDRMEDLSKLEKTDLFEKD
jgi:peptide deformylase